jgi:asparagine synthase (glutamine-hydrolysing)
VCGIVGAISLAGKSIIDLEPRLNRMLSLVSHRGPDGNGVWINDTREVGVGHARLSVIDTSTTGAQPMHSLSGNSITYNGEVYNYKEIRAQSILSGRKFESASDTEVILAAYEKHGLQFVHELRGMFALAIWDSAKKELVLARDRFGIKPLYYLIVDQVLYFGSEVKALIPFLSDVETNDAAMSEYLTFQSLIGDKTLFKNIYQVLPGEIVRVSEGKITKSSYWKIKYDIDYSKDEPQLVEELRNLLSESISLHVRSDVEVGAYLSGGIDSSLVSILASNLQDSPLKAFHGRYVDFDGYDESSFAFSATDNSDIDLRVSDFDSQHVMDDLRMASYHMDYPVAGPGALPQYQISREASSFVKVVLGGQGGDEIFGGYVRYFIGYLEQCLRAAIDGTHNKGNFVVTLESIIPNLGILREYQPLLQKFWRSGLFGPMDERYFQLISKIPDLSGVVNWDYFDSSETLNSYLSVFNDRGSVQKEAYFDSMTHFDFKTLLPSLLQVEDRMSMAHGIESRVPFLDHKIVEFAARVPADVKFKNGELKRLLKVAFKDSLPPKILNRRDKMGFPVPLSEWSSGPLASDFKGVLENLRDRNLPYLNSSRIDEILVGSEKFSRGTWALLSIELWLENFHDKNYKF